MAHPARKDDDQNRVESRNGRHRTAAFQGSDAMRFRGSRGWA
jgi:hypothetical protein